MLNGSCKKGMLVFCLSVLAFNIRAEIPSNANESLELARAIFDSDALKITGLIRPLRITIPSLPVLPLATIM